MVLLVVLAGSLFLHLQVYTVQIFCFVRFFYSTNNGLILSLYCFVVRKLGWEVVNLDLPADQRYNDLAEKRTPQVSFLNYKQLRRPI